MRRISALLGLSVAIVSLLAILAPLPLRGDGSGYHAEAAECESYTGSYDPGKTPTGFYAEATDGCHVAKWEGSLGQGPGAGTVTFHVTRNVDPWAGDLPSMAGGPANACKARAAHEANLFFLYRFEAEPGTEVVVRYRCD